MSVSAIVDHQDGLVLSVRAFPGAKRSNVRMTEDCLKVYVTQIPEKGKANEAIRKQIAKSLNLRISQVELLRGETSSHKQFLLRNVQTDEIQAALVGNSPRDEIGSEKIVKH